MLKIEPQSKSLAIEHLCELMLLYVYIIGVGHSMPVRRFGLQEDFPIYDWRECRQENLDKTIQAFTGCITAVSNLHGSDCAVMLCVNYVMLLADCRPNEAEKQARLFLLKYQRAASMWRCLFEILPEQEKQRAFSTLYPQAIARSEEKMSLCHHLVGYLKERSGRRATTFLKSFIRSLSTEVT